MAGAIWAWRKAKQASDEADVARGVLREISDRRKLVEVSQVHAETKKILKVVAKVGPSSVPEQLTGVDSAEMARQILEYSAFIREQRSHFAYDFEDRATKLCDGLAPHIEALAQATDGAARRDSGKTIYYLIEEFLAIAKEISDEKREHNPER